MVCSPEIWSNDVCNNKSDIWSLGCVVGEMCTLKLIYNAENETELRKKILRG